LIPFTPERCGPPGSRTESRSKVRTEFRVRTFEKFHSGAFRCLQLRVFHLPAVIVRARTVEELGAVRPWFLREEWLFSAALPRLIDFLDDAFVIEYHRSPLIKTLRLKIE
jgi:hypothetical protein